MQYPILAMKQLASFASLGELKNDAVFDSWGNIISRTMVIVLPSLFSGKLLKLMPPDVRF